jgi:hypothetical protein
MEIQSQPAIQDKKPLVEKCEISGEPIYNYEEGQSGSHNYFEYNVIINAFGYKLRFCKNSWKNTSEFITKNRDMLLSHLYNGKTIVNNMNGFSTEDTVIHTKELEKYISETVYPKLPNEKFENLFLQLFGMARYDGQFVRINILFTNELIFLKWYFKNHDELLYYIRALEAEGLIMCKMNSEQTTPIGFNITYKGLNRAIKLQEEGDKSYRCFIAMSFSKDDEYVFSEGIKPVLEDLKLSPIIMIDDKISKTGDQTINDMIIAEIKRSKFVIADFKSNRAGVYFEAGYALGKGKPVIYTCPEDELQKVHFDTSHYPIIIYKDIADLKIKLKARIIANIMD